MNIVPDWAPNVHPMIVHFPIGLLFTAVLLDFVSLIRGFDVLRRAVPVFYVMGALTAIVAYFTGRAAGDQVAVPANAESILTEHADLALWTVLFFCAYAIVRVGVERVLPASKIAVRLPMALVAVIGIFLAWETAEHGSEMVYAHGVGIRQEAPESESIAPPPVDHASMDAVNMGENEWVLQPSGPSMLQIDEMKWFEGDPSSVSVEPAGDGVRLHVDDGPLMFVIDHDLAGVQVFAEVAADSFAGSVMLVHHVQSAATFDFLEISDGEMTLGRSQDGQIRRFDSGTFSRSGWINIRAAGDGRHFRGYLGDQMIVHGHADALPAGPVGLRLDGTGSIRLRLLRARAL